MNIQEIQSAYRQKQLLYVNVWGLDNYEGEQCFAVWQGVYKCLIPFSQTGLSRPEEMFFMLGSKVPVMITEFDRAKEHIVLSVTQAKERLAVETRKNLKVNDVRVGIVQRMTKSRAFIDIDGIDAILMKNEISWAFLSEPSEGLKLGQDVRVKIKEIQEDGTILVSKKVLEEDPWPSITKKITLGQPCIAEVTGRNAYGVYLKIQDGVVALAPHPRNESLTIPNGSRAVVMVNSIKNKKKINCRILRVID